MMSLRPHTDADLAPMLALNNAHAVELGPLTTDSLHRLLAMAMHVRIAGRVDGFLIAFDETAPYDSPNFLWFKARFPRFAYIDRVVIAGTARGRGLARRLYEDLFESAPGHTHVFCEVNYDPPNPGSDAFHATMGFSEIGRATLADRGKSVRYLSREL